MIIIENVANVLQRRFVNSEFMPYDTGNLALRGTTAVGSFGNRVAGFQTANQNATYGVILQTQAKIKGRVNPHYRWINKILEKEVPILAKELGGYVIRWI